MGASLLASIENPTAESFRLAKVPDQARALRVKFAVEHLPGGLVYLEAGQQLQRNGDVMHAFRADSNFIYMTGLRDMADTACVLDTENGNLTLIAPKLPPEAAYWMGPQPTLEQLAETYGADSACYTEDLVKLLGSAGNSTKAVHTTAGLAGKLEELLGAASGSRVQGGLIESTLHRCRAFKTPSEVACLLAANVASGRAHMDMWRAVKPGMYEYQLEAVFRASTMTSGCTQLGYPCIVGSGRNAAVLHYESNNRAAVDGDMVLVDAGAEFRCYTADISRTFPVGGRFVGPQRDVYGAVLAAQEDALSHMVAGASLSEVEASSRRVLMARLKDMGLVTGSVDELMAAKIDRVFMPHGLSHHLGLDVHDVSSTGPVAKTLEAGHVVTCEPGCYFIAPLISKAAADPAQSRLLNLGLIKTCSGMGGVRIEDNVLITPKGPCYNLTLEAGVEKSVAAVERVMASGR